MAAPKPRRRDAAALAGLSPGVSEPDETDDEVIEEKDGEDGAASLLTVSIRRPSTPSARTSPPRGARELVAYWDHVRRGRRFPAPQDIDEHAVTARAPAGLLMRCSVAGRLVLVDKVLACSPSARRGSRPDELLGSGTYAATVLEWLQTLGRQAARDGRPVEEAETFALENDDIQVWGIVLPLSRDQHEVDQLLCHLRT